MQPPMKNNSPDDFQTPASAIKPLLPYLKKDWAIWECASGKGNLVNALKANGYNTIQSDIIYGQNFLTDAPPPFFDCILTNPPYSCKDQFLERAYALGKPFAFLLPLTTFEGKKRQALFKQHGVEVLFLPKRINFETPTGIGQSSWFATAWFCHNLLPKQMIWSD